MRVWKISKRAWTLCVLSALLQILIFPLPGIHGLAWVALAPLLLALLQTFSMPGLQLETSAVRWLPASPRQGFFLGFACGILWYGGTCYWIFQTMYQYGGLSAPLAVAILLLFCLYLGLYHGLFGFLFAFLAGRHTRWQRFALLLAPFLWVAVELARTQITGLPWDLLGTCQVGNIPLAKVATLTGVYGLSFEIVLVNTAVVAALLLSRPQRMRLLTGSLLVAALVESGNWLQLPPVPADRTAVLVQENIPVEPGRPWTTEFYQRTLQELSDLSVASAGGSRTPTDLIVWPESPAPFYARDPFFHHAMSELAMRSQSWVVAGSLGIDTPQGPEQGSKVFNSAALISPLGEWPARYDKVHLVPFGEYVPFRHLMPFMDMLTKEVGDFERGKSRQPLAAGERRLGVFICYESVFPDEVRQFAAAGAQVFVNISNDGWYGDSGAWAQHLWQARMRAVENQRWLLRSTNTGLTAAIDPNGRVVASLPRKQRARLEAPYALLSATTFYTRHGDWFAYACAIISLVALLASFRSAPPTHHS